MRSHGRAARFAISAKRPRLPLDKVTMKNLLFNRVRPSTVSGQGLSDAKSDLNHGFDLRLDCEY